MLKVGYEDRPVNNRDPFNVFLIVLRKVESILSWRHLLFLQRLALSSRRLPAFAWHAEPLLLGWSAGRLFSGFRLASTGNSLCLSSLIPLNLALLGLYTRTNQDISSANRPIE